MRLSRLSEPFPAEDVEWRISRAGIGSRGIYCRVLAYITARAIQKRLDDVCGPSGWKLEEPRVLDLAKPAFACGLSILTAEGEWVTKWDVSEPTNVEPAKGGWSGAMKRAGAQWGIGRYLYYLDEVFAEVTDAPPELARDWNYAKIKTDEGQKVYYWKSPSLPGWALPKDPEHEVSQSALNDLKRNWQDKFAADVRQPAELREGFARFVTSIVGDFPFNDHTCWTRDAHDRVAARIQDTTDPNGPSADVPFGAQHS